jgi:hypothetical protein
LALLHSASKRRIDCNKPFLATLLFVFKLDPQNLCVLLAPKVHVTARFSIKKSLRKNSPALRVERSLRLVDSAIRFVQLDTRHVPGAAQGGTERLAASETSGKISLIRFGARV